MSHFLRTLIEGELTLETPLHVGSGEAVDREGLEVEESEGVKRKAEVSAVVTDHQRRAYLPGRALKGALRSWLAEVDSLRDSPLVEQLLGTEQVRSQEKRGDDKVFGGKAELWNAFVVELPRFPSDENGRPKTPPFWDVARATAVRASVALDRRTRTVSEDRLFFEEFVPPGTKFKLRLSGDHLSDDELRLLLFALSGFNHEPKAVSLGAGGADGNGRFTWKLTGLRRVTSSTLPAWLALGQAGHESLPEMDDAGREPLRLAAEAAWSLPPSRDLEAKVAITFDAPFLVAAPRGKKDREGEPETREPDHVPVTDVHGRPLLPASSLRGALRHRAEKILRTLGVFACRPESKEACRAITEPEQAKGLCAACRLLGAPGWGTLVAVSDFTQVEAQTACPQDFEHVAIDRFTGGVSGALKFNTQAFVGAKLEGTLRLEQSARAEAWMPGLLALVLRDLVQGDLPLGFGSSKGYGACTAEVQRVSGPRLSWAAPQAPPEALRAELTKAVQDFHGWAKQHAKPLPPASSVPLPEALAPAPPRPPAAEAVDGAFLNPYHFVPLDPAMEDPEKVTAEDFAAGKLGALSHDRFEVGEVFFSGRIDFRVKTETPTVVGDKHHRANANEPAVVTPFELDGKPALPGASLRGMISSLAEAATGSAMRVLEDHLLTVRAEMPGLPALGRLVPDATNSARLCLEPLALPPIKCDPQDRPQSVEPWWRKAFPVPSLRVYVNGYRRLGREGGVEVVHPSFLAAKQPSSASSKNPDERWYMRLGKAPTWEKDRPEVSRPHVKNSFLLAQKALEAEPISQQDYDLLDAESQASYTPGLLRVLDIEGHEKEIPSQRTHEIFVPLHEVPGGRPRLEVSEALEKFYLVADQRTEADELLPLRLKGLPRAGKIRLKAGDLVFFQVDKSNPTRVAELALSSIWRKGAGTVFNYVDSEHRPFHPGRKNLSIAERLFGFVEQGLKEAGLKRPALGLASRVLFGFGRLEEGQEAPWYVTAEPAPLAILGSPKPPAPALYFRHKKPNEAAILKRSLDRQAHEVQGRKLYLHQPASNRWRHTGDETERASLRSKAKPLKAGLAFTAHLDFDNLSERELALLLYTLRPTAPFRHLLGMGKPLGLGRVEVTPVAVRCVDRRARYGQETNLLTAPHWHRVQGAQDFADLVGRFRAAMPTALRWVLELVGDPASAQAPVSYPRTADQKADAEEGFKWFVVNQDDRNYEGQQLTPIRNGEGLPALKRNHTPKERSGGPGGHRPGGGSHQQPAGRPSGAPAKSRPKQPGGAPPHRREDRRDRPRDAVAPPPPPKPAEAGRLGSLGDAFKKAREKG